MKKLLLFISILVATMPLVATGWKNPLTNLSEMYKKQQYFAFNAHPTIPLGLTAGYWSLFVLKNDREAQSFLTTGALVGTALGILSGFKNMNLKKIEKGTRKEYAFNASYVTGGCALGVIGAYALRQMSKSVYRTFSDLYESFQSYPV